MSDTVPTNPAGYLRALRAVLGDGATTSPPPRDPDDDEPEDLLLDAPFSLSQLVLMLEHRPAEPVTGPCAAAWRHALPWNFKRAGKATFARLAVTSRDGTVIMLPHTGASVTWQDGPPWRG